MRFASLIAVIVSSVLALGPSALLADDEHDHDRARRAVERGEVMPLQRILDNVERNHPGQVIEVELEQEKGRWIYEIKVLKAGGALVKLEIDARDGVVLRDRERAPGAGGRR
ncbi:PepSY domain-containing protein [Aromatoleum anaerobium]|uniref:PepSY domain-containing protein n=1 Tax=Aromatoleum anaerobium TaxID=182180 RepID=A0ABX1PJN9_9RHOO|nr:PepSY domain-containing protein [Aromatoleum anaerobium]MCK0505589.1 PepSY domain-containing protein [Aromatoleum anaerobium]